MNDNSVKIKTGGDFNAQGSNFGVGNKIIAGAMEQVNKSAASDELKALLEELGKGATAVGEEIAKTDPKGAEGTARDVQAMVDEATSDAPRKNTIERIGEGLLATAKTVGEVGLPVIRVVTKLIALFA